MSTFVENRMRHVSNTQKQHVYNVSRKKPILNKLFQPELHRTKKWSKKIIFKHTQKNSAKKNAIQLATNGKRNNKCNVCNRIQIANALIHWKIYYGWWNEENNARKMCVQNAGSFSQRTITAAETDNKNSTLSCIIHFFPFNF